MLLINILRDHPYNYVLCFHKITSNYQIRHQKALDQSFISAKKSHKCIDLLDKIINKIIIEEKQNDNWTVGIAIKLKPIIEELKNLLIPKNEEDLNLKKRYNSKNIQNQIDMRNVFGFLNYTEWISSISISNVMQITPLTTKDMQIQYNSDSELTRESIMECFTYVVISYFCVATENRMIYTESNEHEDKHLKNDAILKRLNK